ncbi:MAG TPA: hypothetical protein VF372_02285, partial [Thermodesulfobacteriota bacterium]
FTHPDFNFFTPSPFPKGEVFLLPLKKGGGEGFYGPRIIKLNYYRIRKAQGVGRESVMMRASLSLGFMREDGK